MPYTHSLVGALVGAGLAAEEPGACVGAAEGMLRVPLDARISAALIGLLHAIPTTPLYDRLKEAGFTGMTVPKEWGGQGRSFLDAGVVIPPGAVDAPVLITINRIDPDDQPWGRCLPTGLRQVEGCYEYDTEPSLADVNGIDGALYKPERK